MGRLSPAMSAENAAVQLKTISPAIFASVAPSGYDSRSMDTWNGFRLIAIPAPGGISRLRTEYESALWFLLAIAAMVLLIACLNLANLLLAQANAREAEIAVRLALGVSRTRLTLQLVTENLLLALFGTAVGSVLGSMLSSYLLTLLSTGRDQLHLDLVGDWRITTFTLLLALSISVLLGISPVLRLARTDIAVVLRAGGRSGGQQARRSIFQGLLIGSQLAISLFLLVGALSFVRSFRSLSTLDPGFRQNGLVFTFVDFSHLRLQASRIETFETDLLERVRQTPGVTQAASSTHIPLAGSSWSLGVKSATADQGGFARFSWISSSYFRTLGIQLIDGHEFTGHDTATSKKVLIVNQTFARQFSRQQSAVGTLIRSVAEPGYPATLYEIIGVVKDAKYDSLREPVPPAAYAPERQNPVLKAWTAITFRATGSVPDAIAAVRSSLAAKDPEIRTHFDISSTMIEESLSRERLLAWLSGFFAALAILLTCIGLYGVIAYIISLRRAEIAVRLALGATPSQIVSMVVLKTAKIALAGTAVGLVISLIGGRFAQSLLYSLNPADPLTLAGAVAILTVVSLLASMWPALQASMIDPASALHSD